LDSEDRIITDEINSFVRNIKDQRTSIKEEELRCAITGLLYTTDANALEIHHSVRNSLASWLGEENTNLIVQTPENQPVPDRPYATRMRPLHKILLYFAKPGLTKNVKTGTEIFLAANLTLSYNSSTDSYSFVMLNKDAILKYTDAQNCVATPIVLNGIREITQTTSNIIFKPAMRSIGYNNY
jgi:hypothetical protein